MFRRIVDNQTLARTAAALYTILLTYLLLMPHPLDVFGTTGGQAEEAIDKRFSGYLQHVLAYALLVWVLVWAAWRRFTRITRNRVLLLCTAVGTGHALATEFLQIFVPHRYGDLPDAAANLAGIAVGWLIVWLIRPVLPRVAAIPGERSLAPGRS